MFWFVMLAYTMSAILFGIGIQPYADNINEPLRWSVLFASCWLTINCSKIWVCGKELFLQNYSHRCGDGLAIILPCGTSLKYLEARL